jgi:hypothetical protein
MCARDERSTMAGERRPEKDYPTLREDKRDPAYDRLRPGAPEGPPPETERGAVVPEPPKRDRGDEYETLHEDERDPAYDQLPATYPDCPPEEPRDADDEGDTKE